MDTIKKEERVFSLVLRSQEDMDFPNSKIRKMKVQCDLTAESLVEACTFAQSHFSLIMRKPMTVEGAYECYYEDMIMDDPVDGE